MNNSTIMFIMITNNCNLKCSNCMQNCDKNNSPYFIDFKDLQQQLLFLKNKKLLINNNILTEFVLTGGEPLTHPDFINICLLIKEIFPNYQLTVSTNGLLFNKLTNNMLTKLSKINVQFQISLYPNLHLLKMYEKILTKAKKFNLPVSLIGSHFYFSKQDKLINKINPTRGYRDQCKTTFDNQNYVTLFKGRIYTCQKDINFLQREKELKNNSSINIYDIQDQQELIQNSSHSFCNMCQQSNGSGGEEYILWNHHPKNADFIFQHNLKDLYINYYEIYYDLQHNNKQNYKEILQNELFQEHLSFQQKRYANTRYLNGEGDIFIPITQDFNFNLKEFLTKYKNIISYNLYFIDITNNKNIEDKLYSLFTPFSPDSNLNVYLLKASTLLEGYKIFYNNSYLNKKFILDINTLNYNIQQLK